MATPRLTVRRAVRIQLRSIRDEQPGEPLVLVACSGGPDSLALAAAAAFEAPRVGVRAGGVTVDHGLQEGSAVRARAVGAALTRMGLDPVDVVHVQVPAGQDGPEGRARRARYASLDAVARRRGASAVLLGHTLDDQAETVLLGLARGSGARSLSGMAPIAGLYCRPLLRLPRDVVRQSLAGSLPAGVRAWHDPHNAEPAYARVRVREHVLPVLERELGPGVAAALARTAELLRADAALLDDLAWQAHETARLDAADVTADQVAGNATETADQTVGDAAEAADQLGTSAHAAAHAPEQGGKAGPAQASGRAGVAAAASRYDVGVLAGMPRALRWRVLRSAAIAAGCRPTELTAAHIEAVDELITSWRGQKGIDLPGSIRARRRANVVMFDVPK